MKADDTLMSWEQIRMANVKHKDKVGLFYAEALCREQTEITWPIAEKSGMQVVVDWIERQEESSCMDCHCAYDFRKDEWQAQLKVWGV